MDGWRGSTFSQPKKQENDGRMTSLFVQEIITILLIHYTFTVHFNCNNNNSSAHRALPFLETTAVLYHSDDGIDLSMGDVYLVGRGGNYCLHVLFHDCEYVCRICCTLTRNNCSLWSILRRHVLRYSAKRERLCHVSCNSNLNTTSC
jgi:hypothetical protein